MLKAFKYRLSPTEDQKILLNKHLGLARLIFNLALECKSKAWSSNHKNISRYDLQDQLPDLKESQILSEPLRRNTAPCIAYATYKIMSKCPGANVIVAPSDHIILKEDYFLDEIKNGLRYVTEKDVLLTLGLQPNRPETGYGYIQVAEKEKFEKKDNLFRVKTFTEKPDRKMAEVFIETGEFYWNSGIFIWNIKSILSAFEKHMPDMYTVFDEGRDLFGTKQEKSFIGKTYAECRSISIDYGIMEKADNVYVMCTDIGWSDLGTWSSLYEHSTVDNKGNSLIRGEIFSYENERNIFNISPGKIAVIQGLKDFIVVDSEDVLLIVRKEEEQNIKQYLEDVKNATKEKYI